MNKAQILAELTNAIFPSKESDGIETVDMSYKEFMSKLALLASDSSASSASVGKPTGQATILEDVSPMDNFPAHEEDFTR
jgi:hypothetical protein